MRTEEQISGSTNQPTDDGSRSARAVICKETARICAARYGRSLRAVVLTGSLARNEATFIEEGGGCKLLGDADLFLVFHNTAREPSASAVETTSREVESVLSEKRIIGHVGLQAVNVSYLQRRLRHIEPFELRHNGCVIWGDRDVLSLIPIFSADQILLEDAWRLLANRIVELLEAVTTAIEPGDAAFEDTFYRTIKLFLDMATSYLIFAGHYRPTYRQRAVALRNLADVPDQAASPFPLTPFADRVSACTRFKLERQAIAATQADLLRDAIHFAHLLWRWELMRLTGQNSQLCDAELMRRWMYQQPIKARIRGWASVVRRSGAHQSWREWPRWIRLGRRASPRYWVYSVGTEVFFHLPEFAGKGLVNAEPEMDWKELSSRLPLPNLVGSDRHTLTRRDVAVRAALNYRRLLEPTTA